MSEMKNWISRPQQVQQANRDIIAARMVTVFVQRSSNPDTEDSTGFSTEMPTEAGLRTINVRLEPPKYRGDEADLLGFTEDTDVRKNDRWFWTNSAGHLVKLRVSGFSYRESSSLEVALNYE